MRVTFRRPVRLPDRLFRVLERVYRAQDALRRRELSAAVEREDAQLRAYYARMRAQHQAGTCGGAAAGCRYVPCIPRVGA